MQRQLSGSLLGLLLATIGLDLAYATNRFNFRSADLMAGLNFIPVLIGLFALPEIIDVAANKITNKSKASTVSDSKLSFDEYKQSFKTILRGSLIGVVLGAIPE